MDFFANERVLQRQGNATPYASPHGIFPCAGEDSWCAIAVLDDLQWETLCGIIADPSLTNVTLYATLEGRKQAEGEIHQRVSEWTAARPAEEVESLLTSKGLPASVVEGTAYLIEKDEHLKSRSFFRTLDHSVIGPHLNRGPAFRFSRSKDRQFAGPALGEHNDHVFKELLGMTDAEVAEAIRERGITTEADLGSSGGAF